MLHAPSSSWNIVSGFVVLRMPDLDICHVRPAAEEKEENEDHADDDRHDGDELHDGGFEEQWILRRDPLQKAKARPSKEQRKKQVVRDIAECHGSLRLLVKNEGEGF